MRDFIKWFKSGDDLEYKLQLMFLTVSSVTALYLTVEIIEFFVG